MAICTPGSTTTHSFGFNNASNSPLRVQTQSLVTCPKRMPTFATPRTATCSFGNVSAKPQRSTRRRHRSGSGPTPVKSLSKGESDLLRLQRELLESLLKEFQSAEESSNREFPDDDNEDDDDDDRNNDDDKDKRAAGTKRDRDESNSFYDLKVEINEDGHHELKRVKRVSSTEKKDTDDGAQPRVAP